VNVWENVPSYH